MNIKILWFYPSPKKRTEGFLGHFTIEIEDFSIILRGVGVNKKGNHYSIYLPNRPQIGRDGEVFHHTLLDFKSREDKKIFVTTIAQMAPDYIKNHETTQAIEKIVKESIATIEKEAVKLEEPKKKRGRPKKIKPE